MQKFCIFLLSLTFTTTIEAQLPCSTFTDSGQLLGGFYSASVALGDLDGDGDSDAFVANSGQPNRVYMNDGTGTYTDSGQLLGNSWSSSVALGDLDGDGDLDAFVANFNGQPNRVYLNQGGLQLGTPGTYSDSGQALGSFYSRSVALGDLDGDGDLDAFVANFAGDPNRVYLNQGGLQLGTPGTYSDSGQLLGIFGSTSVALEDLDGDGDLDAFVASSVSNRVYLNQGGLQSGTPGTYTDSGQLLGNSWSSSVALGDLDGDGDLDAWVANYGGQPNRMYLNQGGLQSGTPGTYSDSGQLLGSFSSNSVALGDLDEDGDLDAFVANEANPGESNRVYLNDGTTGTFSDSGQLLGSFLSNSVALGDLDGDCDLDAFVANFNGQPNRVYLKDGCLVETACNNGLDDDCDGLIDCEDPDCPVSYTDSGQLLGSFNSLSVALGDLDGDGDIDAFVANHGDPTRVYLNQGGLQSGTPGTYTDSGQAIGSFTSFSVALGDLDGDGDLDAFVANNSSQPNRVFMNDGTGIYTDSGQAFGSFYSYSVALGDLDDDGDLDAFVANSGQPNRVYMNDGTGTYTDSGQLLGSFASSSVALGDLDGDGDLDAWVANYGWQPNRMYLNQGGLQSGTPGTYSDSGQLLGSFSSNSVALGDLDDDGDLDAFVANAANPNRVYLNDGTTGTFSDSGQALGSFESFSVALGDLDGDCDLDAFVANNGQPNRVYLNQGGLQSGTPGTYSDNGQALGNFYNSRSVALGDLDGDGDLDAFVANNSQPNRVWLKDGNCPACTVENCANGIDDDFDLLIDCDDPDCTLDPACTIAPRGWDEQQRLLPPTGQPDDHFGRVVAVDGDRLVIGSNYDDDLGAYSGSASVFERDAATGLLQETQLLLASNGSSMDFFGTSVAIAGDFIFVGAHGADGAGSSSGAVYVFVRNALGQWSESQILTPGSGNSSNSFGRTVVVRGNLLAVGDPTDSTIFTGSVFLFQFDPQTGLWSQQQQLIPPIGPANQDSFGRSIAIGDGTILIGRPDDSVGIGYSVGSAYVYTQESADGDWNLEQQLLSSTPQQYESFGGSVAVGDGVLVISAFASFAGPNVPPASTRIFERDSDSGVWIETQQLTCTSGCGGPTYQTIALEGDILAIGEVQDPATGSVTIYRRDLQTGQWFEIQRLIPSVGSSGDFFGASIGISGPTIVVGAYNDDGLGSNAGAAYVFRTSGFLRDCNSNGTEDEEDIASGFSNDCNGNGIPDECDLETGISQDVNDNQIPDECEEPTFVRGDANSDGAVDVGDVQFSLMTIFEGEAQVCSDGQDTNDDGALDLSDPIYTLLYLFADGSPPPAPFPNCGVDPTPDALGCASFPPCP